MDVVAAVEFERWCEDIQLSNITRQLLKSEGFTTLEAVRLLGETDLEVLNLDSTQREILEDALATLNTRASQTSNQPTPVSPRSRPNSIPDIHTSSVQSTQMAQQPNSRVYPDLSGFDNEFSDPEPEMSLEPENRNDHGEPEPEPELVPEQPEAVAEFKQQPAVLLESKKKKKSKPFAIPSEKSDAQFDEFSAVAGSPSAKSAGFLTKFKNSVPKSEKFSIGKDANKENKEVKEKDGKNKDKKKVKLPKFMSRARKTSQEIDANGVVEIEREDEYIVAEEEPETTNLALDTNDDNENDSLNTTTTSAIEVSANEHPLAALESPVVKSIKEKFLENSTLTRGGYPEVFQLPQVTVSRDDETFIRHCEIAIPDFPVELVVEEKVLLCVGASGAGKTTLINGLANYLLDVQWDDPYRFQIIPDYEDRADMESQSQTKLITAYTFYIERDPFRPSKITIIDTPGFGDTAGIDRDQELDNKIRNLFDQTTYGLDQLHAVCFATQASETRLNAFQRYIYNRVLSIFGKDVERNIFMMVTFADAQTPPVVRLLEENHIPFEKYFKFNNSALFAKNTAAEDNNEQMFNQMFWNMGVSSFQAFLEYLDSSVEPVALSLTKEVMAKRDALQVYIAGLQENVKKGLVTLDQMRQEMDVVRQHEADIARNRDFTYKVKEHYTEKVDKPEGRHVTNCQNCNRTCHLNCKYANDSEKKKCSAMDSNGDCRVCTPSHGGKCSWRVHFNMSYYFLFKQRIVEKRSDELFHKYQKATDLKVTAETLLAKIGDKFSNIQGEVLWQTNEIRKCLAQLGEIALKPNPLTTVDYIDQMVIAEKDTCQPGWRERVYQLENARKRAEYLQKLADEGYDPWEEHSGIDETRESRMNSVSEFLMKLKSGVWSLIADDDDEDDDGY